LLVDWRATASLENVTLRHRPTGMDTWTEVLEASAPYEITGLLACVDYDVQVIGNCGGTPAETTILRTTTDGCCIIPEDFTVLPLANQIFQISWTQLLAASDYKIRYRALGDSSWLTRTSRSGGLLLAGNIAPCSPYEFEFQTNCDTLVTDFGSRMVVSSLCCGSCNEVNYCTPEELDNELEWIREVNLGNILVRQSGAETGGYRSFGEITPRPFVRGGAYPITITPDFRDGAGVDAFRVYIDWDQNGIFSESEIAAETNNPVNESARAVITIPDDADLLLTRMRVLMQFQGVRNDCPRSRAFGEAEDYCINIGEADPACPPPTIGSLRIDYDADDNATYLRWQASNAAGGTYRVRYRLRDSMDDWVVTDVEGIELTINDLNLCGAYEFEVASLCGGTPGVYRLFYFNDNCTTTRNQRLPDLAWSVFPNPATERTTVSWRPGLRPTNLSLYDLNGRLLQRSRNAGGASLAIDLTRVPAGIYLVRLQTADGRTGIQRVVVR
ncbi:MAG: GEVED domain-containing protein, partial [Bacteroidota bacterium]